MKSISDEVIVFGASAEECLEAMDHYSAELWSSVDEAMELLWESDEERSKAEEAFSTESLLLSPVEEHGGAAVLELDSEADVAAETLSALLCCPVISLQILEGRWCKLVAFDEGRRLGWLFWVALASMRPEGEILPAVVASAEGSGGWIGDPEVFEAFVPGQDGPRILDILDKDWGDPADLAEAVKAAIGLGEQEGNPVREKYCSSPY